MPMPGYEFHSAQGFAAEVFPGVVVSDYSSNIEPFPVRGRHRH